MCFARSPFVEAECIGPFRLMTLFHMVKRVGMFISHYAISVLGVVLHAHPADALCLLAFDPVPHGDASWRLICPTLADLSRCR